MRNDQRLSEHEGHAMAHARAFLAPYRPFALTVALYAMVVGVFALVTPIAVQALVNTAAFGTLLQPVVILALLITFALAISAVLKLLQSFTVEILQRRMFVEVVAEVAHVLPRLHQACAGDAAAKHPAHRFFDLFTVQKASASLLLGGIDLLLATGVGLLVLAFYHPFFLAFDMLLLLSLAVVVFGLGRRGVATAVDESSQKYALAAFLAEIDAPGAHTPVEAEIERVRRGADALSRHYLAARGRHFGVVMRQFGGALFVQAIASAALLGLGGYLVIERELSLGQLVAGELIVAMVLSALSDFGKYAETYYDLVASTYKLDTLLTLPTVDSTGAVDVPDALTGELARGRPRASLSAAALVPEIFRVRRVAIWLATLLVGFAVLSAFLPFQQTVSGEGRVIAYAPSERRQTVDTPISGRVVRFWVQEGAAVNVGDPLVEILDNDPLLLERLAQEREAVQQKLENYEERAASLLRAIDSAGSARRSDIASAEAKLRAATGKLRSVEQKLEAADAALETATLNLGRVRALAERGLTAQRDLELAELTARKAHTERDGAQADVVAGIGDVDAARANLEKSRAEGEGKVQDSEAKLRSAKSDEADALASLMRLEVSIARQSGQVVRAPQKGIVLKLLVAQGGAQVKQGDSLLVLVPDTEDRAVEIWVDGNDASIISAGRKVRMQFEGWPAVQFSGWPSVAVGTFGGVVAFVDPADDGKGNFRMLVVPDDHDEAWPSPRYLRQGVRTKAWVLLDKVRLGFELWRRFNGFPPSTVGPDETPTKAQAGKGQK